MSARPWRVPPRSELAKYGLTPEDYIALWEAQKGRCMGCEKSFTRNRVACIDHNHRTGVVRGLLCRACNYLLGTLHEDLHWLTNIVLHLTHPIAGRIWREPRRHIHAPPEA